jgi:hypothetical protein
VFALPPGFFKTWGSHSQFPHISAQLTAFAHALVYRLYRSRFRSLGTAGYCYDIFPYRRSAVVALLNDPFGSQLSSRKECTLEHPLRSQCVSRRRTQGRVNPACQLLHGVVVWLPVSVAGVCCCVL